MLIDIGASACLTLQCLILSDVFFAHRLRRSWVTLHLYAAEHGVISAVLHMETRRTVTWYEKLYVQSIGNVWLLIYLCVSLQYARVGIRVDAYVLRLENLIIATANTKSMHLSTLM